MALALAGRVAYRVGFWTVAALAVLLSVAISMRVLTFDPMVIAEELRQNVLSHPWTFWTHAVLGPVALLTGTFQFLPVTRRSAYHRWAGRIYVVACLVSACAGFSVAFTTSAGPVAGTGFAILAVLWAGATIKAYLTARRRDFAAHRRWMIRSYALTCSAITLRLILIAGSMIGFGFFEVYVFTAWSSWLINLAIAEAVIRLRGRVLRPARAGAEIPERIA